jgi:hypothetical protein
VCLHFRHRPCGWENANIPTDEKIKCVVECRKKVQEKQRILFFNTRKNCSDIVREKEKREDEKILVTSSGAVL